MILVRVFRLGDKAEVRLELSGDIIDEYDEFPAAGQLSVGVVTKEDVFGTHYPGGLELFLFSNLRVTVALTVGDHKKEDTVALLFIFGQRPRAPVLDRHRDVPRWLGCS